MYTSKAYLVQFISSVLTNLFTGREFEALLGQNICEGSLSALTALLNNFKTSLQVRQGKINDLKKVFYDSDPIT